MRFLFVFKINLKLQFDFIVFLFSFYNSLQSVRNDILLPTDRRDYLTMVYNSLSPKKKATTVKKQKLHKSEQQQQQQQWQQ